MRFYRVTASNPGPNGHLFSSKRGRLLYGDREVTGILPNSYGIVVYDRAPKWPDLLDSFECMLWSQRVVEAFKSVGLQGAEFYPQELKGADDKRLLKQPYPNYHWAHALTGVPAIPFLEDGVTPCPIDPETGFYNLSKGSGLRLWKFDFSQWQGADLFYISTAHTSWRYCTQRLKDLVGAHEFTNFRFSGARNEVGDEFFV